MYKIDTTLGNSYIIIKNDGNLVISFTQNSANRDYQQFIKDVAEQGYDIVEGPDVIQPSYADLRRPEYPSIEDQLDKIYHSGVAAWKKDIKEIKDKYPKAITGRTDIAPLPDWLYTDVNNYRYNQQLKEYVNAVERLAQHRLIETQERLVDEVLEGTVYYTVETQPYIEGLPADDPRVVQDEAERAEAQAIIDATPQNVIDAINN
jgi:hypothetical protein|tara:strand:+ start:134 stop:748 length:615 start_codon:yes stop_codon:yes gene_type:complete